jgi:hypothetical protein
LIDPRKNVASTAAFAASQTNYALSYSEASPTVRRAYLQWLADGRSAPDADIVLSSCIFMDLSGASFLISYGMVSEQATFLTSIKNSNDCMRSTRERHHPSGAIARN